MHRDVGVSTAWIGVFTPVRIVEVEIGHQRPSRMLRFRIADTFTEQPCEELHG